MTKEPRASLVAYSTVVVALFVAVAACSDSTGTEFPRPSEPLETVLYDLVDGPVHRASAFDVVAGRGTGLPRSVRVDRTGEWDVVFGVLDGEPVWLPRGFFKGLQPSSGVLGLKQAFEDIIEAPENRDLYNTVEPVPIVPDEVYVFRSRTDPSLSFPCRIYALVDVLEVDSAENRIKYRYTWNPNCDQREVSPEQL